MLGRFLDYVASKDLTLYPAQEEAVLELFEGKNVILNTPTGSGRSLVASALHFASLAHGRRSVYTCPIKAALDQPCQKPFAGKRSPKSALGRPLMAMFLASLREALAEARL